MLHAARVTVEGRVSQNLMYFHMRFLCTAIQSHPQEGSFYFPFKIKPFSCTYSFLSHMEQIMGLVPRMVKGDFDRQEMSLQLLDRGILFSENQYISLRGMQVLESISRFLFNIINCLFLLSIVFNIILQQTLKS